MSVLQQRKHIPRFTVRVQFSNRFLLDVQGKPQELDQSAPEVPEAVQQGVPDARGVKSGNSKKGGGMTALLHFAVVAAIVAAAVAIDITVIDRMNRRDNGQE